MKVNYKNVSSKINNLCHKYPITVKTAIAVSTIFLVGYTIKENYNIDQITSALNSVGSSVRDGLENLISWDTKEFDQSSYEERKQRYEAVRLNDERISNLIAMGLMSAVGGVCALLSRNADC